MKIVNLYQSDVREMSDAELARLSEELVDAYECGDGDECYWTDDEAEVRYYEMRREIRRRWAVANPKLAEQPQPLLLAKSVLAILNNQLPVTRAMATDFECTKPMKVGDTVTVRKPYRFTSKDYLA